MKKIDRFFAGVWYRISGYALSRYLDHSCVGKSDEEAKNRHMAIILAHEQAWCKREGVDFGESLRISRSL